jgi:LmbE family N-acetylglucosaminyl deacetylase
MQQLTRREICTVSGVLAGGLAVGLPLVEAGEKPANPERPQRKLKAVVVGAHPDDPESGCGGTMARYAGLGHKVVALYLTRGENGIRGKSHKEAAAIRTAEVKKACAILGAQPLFAGQIDGRTEANRTRYREFQKLLDGEEPDIVFTHWPIDEGDHHVASVLTYQAWYYAPKKFALYYFEVASGSWIGTQTRNFHPTHYVDITATQAKKRAACYAHKSQDPNSFYAAHDVMNRFRGMEAGCKFAEAFVRLARSARPALPLVENG